MPKVLFLGARINTDVILIHRQKLITKLAKEDVHNSLHYRSRDGQTKWYPLELKMHIRADDCGQMTILFSKRYLKISSPQINNREVVRSTQFIYQILDTWQWKPFRNNIRVQPRIIPTNSVGEFTRYRFFVSHYNRGCERAHSFFNDSVSFPCPILLKNKFPLVLRELVWSPVNGIGNIDSYLRLR